MNWYYIYIYKSPRTKKDKRATHIFPSFIINNNLAEAHTKESPVVSNNRAVFTTINVLVARGKIGFHTSEYINLLINSHASKTRVGKEEEEEKKRPP